MTTTTSTPHSITPQRERTITRARRHRSEPPRPARLRDARASSPDRVAVPTPRASERHRSIERSLARVPSELSALDRARECGTAARRGRAGGVTSTRPSPSINKKTGQTARIRCIRSAVSDISTDGPVATPIGGGTWRRAATRARPRGRGRS